VINSSIASKNQRFSRAQICFLGNLNVKESHNMNSTHQMKPYDTKIDSFGGLSQLEQHFLSTKLFLNNISNVQYCKVLFFPFILFDQYNLYLYFYYYLLE